MMRAKLKFLTYHTEIFLLFIVLLVLPLLLLLLPLNFPAHKSCATAAAVMIEY